MLLQTRVLNNQSCYKTYVINLLGLPLRYFYLVILTGPELPPQCPARDGDLQYLAEMSTCLSQVKPALFLASMNVWALDMRETMGWWIMTR